jgi:hypothetical protein
LELAGRSLNVTTAAIVPIFAAGAALIAFWTVARFPSAGPQTVPAALATAAASFVLQTPLLRFVEPVASDAGVAPALLCVVLPSLTLLFWSSGCLVRTLIKSLTPHSR